MSAARGVRPERAPLHTVAHRICRLLDERRHAVPEAELRGLRDRAHALYFAVTRALTFPHERRDEIRNADNLAMELRLALRLAGDARVLDAGFLRTVQTEILHVGRMLGGWQRTLDSDAEDRHLRDYRTQRGARSHAAASARSAAAATGTTPTGVAPPTATGTGPTMPTTTLASGSSCPPNPRVKSTKRKTRFPPMSDADSRR